MERLELGLVDDLPANEKYGYKEDHKIREHECRRLPVSRQKDRVSANDSHGDRPQHAVIGHIGLANGSIRQASPIDSLSFERAHPHEERKGHEAEVQKLTGCNSSKSSVSESGDVMRSATYKLTNQSRTLADPALTCRKASKLMARTAMTQL